MFGFSKKKEPEGLPPHVSRLMDVFGTMSRRLGDICEATLRSEERILAFEHRRSMAVVQVVGTINRGLNDASSTGFMGAVVPVPVPGDSKHVRFQIDCGLSDPQIEVIGDCVITSLKVGGRAQDVGAPERPYRSGIKSILLEGTSITVGQELVIELESLGGFNGS
jgi:hypothetical protein